MQSCYFSITIGKRSDFLILENAIRTLLNCQRCSFFQSASYVDLRLSVLAHLVSGAPRPPPSLLPISVSSPFMLVLLDDGCTLQLKSASVFFDNATTEPTVRIRKKEEVFFTALTRSRQAV